MNSFSPLTMYLSPRSSAVVRNAVKVRTGTGFGQRECGQSIAAAAKSAGIVASVLIAKRPTGSTAPIQPCTLANPAIVGSCSAILVRNGAKYAKRCPAAPVLLIDEQTPVAGVAQTLP